MHRILLLLVPLVVASAASAKPTVPRVMCAEYPDAPMCRGYTVACTQCHTSVPAWNVYGEDVAAALADGTGDYDTDLPAALAAIESNDSDGDGLSNLEEILLGTKPGDASSFFIEPAAPQGEANTQYDLGNIDVGFAHKRMMVTACGRSPTYDERQALLAAPDPSAALHAALDTCLTSTHWLQKALPRLADKRIRPLAALGTQSTFVTLGDYEWDYRLFVHILSGDRDARDLLLADYHVDVDGNVVDGVIQSVGGANRGQRLAVDKRAGMITTTWFLTIHTMFSLVPRTTAAQAYRAYLGQDIAKSEGLLPIENEPADVDNKGVAQSTCAQCHATLDPLSYGFAYYNGIAGPLGNGSFNANRPTWNDADVTSSLLGEALTSQEETGVRSWATVAVNSPAFRRNFVNMFAEQWLGRAVLPNEQEEFAALEETVVSDGHNANRLIHRIIDTRAFGAP
jgi:hypothetical protein